MAKMTSIHLEKCQRAWRCRINFRIQTRRQFTMECHEVEGSGKGLFRALVSGLIAKYRKTKHLKSIPGDFPVEKWGRAY